MMDGMESLRKYIGIPYDHEGRDERGLNCWTFVKLAFRQERGVELLNFADDYSDSVPVEDRKSFAERFQAQWSRIEKPGPWDIVVMDVVGSLHVGIFAGHGRFVHCTKAGVSVGHLGDRAWGKIIGYFRYVKNNG